MTLTEFYTADIFDIDFFLTHLDEVERDAMERMRMIVWAVLAPYSKEQKSPEDIMKFRWEEDGKKTVTTKKQFDEMFKDYKNKMNYGNR